MHGSQVPPDVLDAAWAEWRLDHNRRGLRLALILVICLHPVFAGLDLLVSPRRWLPLLLGYRVVSELISLSLLRALPRPWVARRIIPVTALYMISVASGITLATVVLGGYDAYYYAGLNLVMVGAGLLYVWPVRVALLTYGTIFASFMLGNLADWRDLASPAGASSVIFLFSTASIVTAGHYFSWRSARQQVRDRLAVQRASETLARANEDLQRLDRFKSRFFANITHELKTPLAMILSPVELMVDGEFGPLSEPQRATLRSVYRAGARLLKLIADLLDLSRIEESRLRLRLGEHDLVAWLRTMVSQVAPLTDRKRIDLRLETSVETLFAWCDLDRLERVFVNLLSNAAKFTPFGGKVTVRVSEAGGAARVDVEDNGPGFPEEFAHRVFERFFQVDDAGGNRAGAGGTGIGLALAKELVELHGGTISARGGEGRGATFTVVLPTDREHFRPEVVDRRSAARSVLDDRRGDAGGMQAFATELANREEFRFLDVADATERRAVERDRDEASRGRSVLVVEDNPEVLKLVHLVLRQHFRVLTAPNGVKGLELATRERPDVIVTDLMMPEMDGYELTRHLRADPRTRSVPVVMVTARGETDDRVQGLESGVSAYLTKPFAARELLTTVLRQLESREQAAEQVLSLQMDSLETIAGGLAHEINNPLNYIRNALARIRLDVTEVFKLTGPAAPEEVSKRLSALEKRSTQMFDTAQSGIGRISETVSLMGRYSREGYARVLRPHDLFAAVEDVVRLVVPAIPRAVEVVRDLSGDGTVECVPEEVHQVFTNLIQNAVEAAPDGDGRVVITGRADDESVTVSVRDNGPGISSDAKARIFTPFFTTKEPGRGMGLGLTIVWRVVHVLGGTVGVEGALGEGATFIVRLPRRQPTGRAGREAAE